MFDQLSELEGLTRQLEHITSIFNILCESYFEDAEPDAYRLQAGYTDYTNVINAIRDMVMGQRGTLHDTTDRLYKVYWQLKKLSERYIALLKGEPMAKVVFFSVRTKRGINFLFGRRSIRITWERNGLCTGKRSR